MSCLSAFIEFSFLKYYQNKYFDDLNFILKNECSAFTQVLTREFCFKDFLFPTIIYFLSIIIFYAKRRSEQTAAKSLYIALESASSPVKNRLYTGILPLKSIILPMTSITDTFPN
jgi:hypothetical protein